MTIPTIVIHGGNVPTIRTTTIFMPPSWLTDNPPQAIPIYGPVASPDVIGVPVIDIPGCCLLYTSPSPRDRTTSRMPSSA